MCPRAGFQPFFLPGDCLASVLKLSFLKYINSLLVEGLTDSNVAKKWGESSLLCHPSVKSNNTPVVTVVGGRILVNNTYLWDSQIFKNYMRSASLELASR